MSNEISDKRAIRLLISNMIYRAWKIIAQIFLNIYLFKISWDIWLVMIFNIILYLLHFFGFVLFWKIVKYGYRNLMHYISLFWMALIYFIVMILWEHSIDYYMSIAFTMWIFSWMYWITYNNNEFDLTKTGNRWNFQWLKTSLKILNTLLIPALTWTIIWLNFLGYGYEIAFWIWCLLFLVSWIVWSIKPDYPEKKQDYDLIKAVRIMASDKDVVKSNLNSTFLWFSLSNPLMESVLPLILFSYWIKEMDLWSLVSLFAFITMVFSYLYWKYVPYWRYKLTYTLAWLFYVLSVLILLFFPSYIYVIIFTSLLNLIFVVIAIPHSVATANTLHNIVWFEKMKAEYMVIRELPLTIWRIMAFSSIYFIWSFSYLWIQILFWVMAVIMIISILVYRSINLKTS